MISLRNHVQLIGHLGNDPEFVKLNDGKSMLKMSIATNETYLNVKGEEVTETEWHNLIAWGKSAERLQNQVKKGSHLAVAGKLQHRKYTGKDGVNRTSTQVLVQSYVLLSKKPKTTAMAEPQPQS